MVSTYGGGFTAPILGLAAGCDCMCNNTSLCDPTNICYNATLCGHVMAVAATDPTGMHLLAALPICVGGIVLTNTSVRLMRLWAMEAYSEIMKRFK